MGLGVGKRPLQHPNTMQRPVVGESHCTCLAQVMHLGQLGSLTSFCDAGHWKHPRRDAMFMGNTGFGHDMEDGAGMVRGRRVGRQQGDMRESCSGSGLQTSDNALLCFFSWLSEMHLPIDPARADHASWALQHFCPFGSQRWSYLLDDPICHTDVHRLVVPWTFGVPYPD